MTDAALLELALAAGLAPRWRDVFDQEHAVSPDTLRLALAALDLPAATRAQIRESHAALAAQAEEAPPLLTARQGAPIALRGQGAGHVRIRLENGEADAVLADGELPAIDTQGYHTLELPDREVVLAVAPARCLVAGDFVAERGRRLWGLAVQLYALRHPGDGGIGDFTALAQFARSAASHGADAVAISPVHAQFSADLHRFSPYSPSSRVLLNIMHIDAGAPDDPTDRVQAEALIDWPEASRRKLARLRLLWRNAGPKTLRDFAAFRVERGDVLESHARFEALHAHMLADHPRAWHWRDWPAEYRSPELPAVARFAAEHEDEVSFHAFAQFLADSGLAAAQHACRDAGMAIGLISDLAVGTDGGGSHCWSRQAETLLGLSVGAPPDLLSPAGQDWGLTSFSPRGLALHGYGAFIDMLRASLRHAGGVRIDHVMGLARLWVIPTGAGATEGVYVRFPQTDLLRLVALESRRHQAIVLGEDLGTVPDGFQDVLDEQGIAGLRVLWFERFQDTRFKPPGEWTKGAVAMTSTHDLPTVAGWWEGRDLQWREQIGMLRDPSVDHDERARDRGLLWDAFRASGAALHEPPALDEGHHAAGSAAVHIGISACDLALLPIEDALALREQPNLPGTLDEHPNWRRRLPGLAADLLDDPMAEERLAALAAARRENA